jgi:organic radical activating enzyme
LRKEFKPKTVDEILATVGEVDEVVLTGGEPLLHQNNPAWAELLRSLSSRSIFISIETNGTISPNPVTRTFVGHYSISPKLANAGLHKPGQSTGLAEWPNELKHRSACLKFVVTGAKDVQTAAELADAYGWPRWQTWVMPEGTTTEALLYNFRAITDAAIKNGLNVSQRLHVFAYGNERGT